MSEVTAGLQVAKGVCQPFHLTTVVYKHLKKHFKDGDKSICRNHLSRNHIYVEIML